MTRITTPEVADLSPSAKLVYLVLEDAGPCSVADLRGRTQLSDRSLRRALDELDDVEVVESRANPRDARSDEYDVVR